MFIADAYTKTRKEKWMLARIRIVFMLGLITGIISVLLTGGGLQYFSEKPVIQELGVVGSGSMLPLMYPDVELKTVDYDQSLPLKCGHIYIYKNNESERIVHRFIYETKEGKIIFKGDNNQYNDQPVNRSQIIYEIVGVELT